MKIAHKLLMYNTHQIARTLPWQQSKIFVRQSPYPFLGGCLVSIMVLSEVNFEEDALSKECMTLVFSCL